MANSKDKKARIAPVGKVSVRKKKTASDKKAAAKRAAARKASAKKKAATTVAKSARPGKTGMFHEDRVSDRIINKAAAYAAQDIGEGVTKHSAKPSEFRSRGYKTSGVGKKVSSIDRNARSTGMFKESPITDIVAGVAQSSIFSSLSGTTTANRNKKSGIPDMDKVKQERSTVGYVPPDAKKKPTISITITGENSPKPAPRAEHPRQTWEGREFMPGGAAPPPAAKPAPKAASTGGTPKRTNKGAKPAPGGNKKPKPAARSPRTGGAQAAGPLRSKVNAMSSTGLQEFTSDYKNVKSSRVENRHSPAPKKRKLGSAAADRSYAHYESLMDY